MSSYIAKPNEKQIGGGHYQVNGLQCWDFIVKHRLGYLEGNYVKYITRNRAKNGLKDLQKARHYALKILDNAKRGVNRAFEPTGRLTAKDLMIYARANELNPDEIYLLSFVDWRTIDEAQQLYDAIDAYLKPLMMEHLGPKGDK